MVAKILLIKKNRLSLHRLRATIELWCNGNTADFGSVILSSNLGSSTTMACLTNFVRQAIFLIFAHVMDLNYDFS